MKRLEVHFAPTPETSRPVGVLAEEGGRVYFEYAQQWLHDGLKLSPIRLPMRTGMIEHTDRSFGPLPGLFDDSLPDGWGLLLMDRYFRKMGCDPSTLSPLDRLAWVGDRAMGALTYHPAAASPGDGGFFDLHELAKESQAVLEGDEAEVLPVLIEAGGSPGGARPKVLIGFHEPTSRVISGADALPEGFEPWIVKFAAKQDSADAGPVEYAYWMMAQAAGIDMPLARLFTTPEGDRFFGVKRFDRIGRMRVHMHTFGNLIHANFRIPSCDYRDLMKVTAILTRQQEQIQRVFARMAFNVLAHNRDDHAKNFAFLMDSQTGRWSLSPAYDLVFAPGPGGEHTTTIAGEGRSPGRGDLLRAIEKTGLGRDHAEATLAQVAAAVARWGEFAVAAGVSPATAKRIATQLKTVACL